MCVGVNLPRPVVPKNNWESEQGNKVEMRFGTFLLTKWDRAGKGRQGRAGEFGGLLLV